MEMFGFNTKYVPNDYGYVKQLILASRPDMDKNMVLITTKKSKENNFDIDTEVVYKRKIIESNDTIINKFKEIMELKNFKGIGLYNYNNNKIFYNLDRFIRDMNFNDLQYEELRLLQLIYHELHHQLQWFNNKEIFDAYFNNYDNYTKYHDYYEFEIDAEIESRKRLILDLENYEYPNLRDCTGILYHEIDKTKQLRKDKIYNNVNK